MDTLGIPRQTKIITKLEVTNKFVYRYFLLPTFTVKLREGYENVFTVTLLRLIRLNLGLKFHNLHLKNSLNNCKICWGEPTGRSFSAHLLYTTVTHKNGSNFTNWDHFYETSIARKVKPVKKVKVKFKNCCDVAMCYLFYFHSMVIQINYLRTEV